MTNRTYQGLFIAEGTSDAPLADIVESLFFDRGVTLYLSRPDFSTLRKVHKDVKSRITAGLTLAGGPVDVIVAHRDADSAGPDQRRQEIGTAARNAGATSAVLPVVPVRMTEAWLLLDELAIRRTAGNPRGKVALDLPKPHEAEGLSDPKQVLAQCLIAAAEVTGRRRDQAKRRFNEHRRQLLERLDTNGPVARLTAWRQLLDDVDKVVQEWTI